MRCPTCRKENTLRPWKGPLARLGIEASAVGERCISCGEILIGGEELQRHERAVADGLVARGIRTAKEFQFVRKMAGLRAAELAALLDVRPETVSRWERGEVDIPRAVAFVLAELFVHPKLARQRLEALAS